MDGPAYTQHALYVLEERGISKDWVERVIRNPTRVVPDPVDPELVHFLGRIIEREGRVLRVIYNSCTNPNRVIAAYFDRTMQGKL